MPGGSSSSHQARAPLLEEDDDPERGPTPPEDDVKDLEARCSPCPSLAVPAIAAAPVTGPPLSARLPTRLSTPQPTRLSTPQPTRLSTRLPMRSRSSNTNGPLRSDARRKYLLAAIFLLISLISFAVQTELARYIQHELHWNKAYSMLYFTHGSWALLWPAQLLVMRLHKRRMPWATFWRSHVDLLRSTTHMVAEQRLDVPEHILRRSPVPYMLQATAVVTLCLTFAGLTWYVAIDMTTPSDLTAIYNCSAFFAYVFSVPLLKEKLRLDKSLAVLVAIVGVLVVAYGGAAGGDAADGEGAAPSTGTRFLGNLIIGAGSVMYGLYEVLYKRFSCPPEGTSAARSIIFANTLGGCIGASTLLLFWIPLPILHVTGWETFEFPTGLTALYLFITMLMNATFAGSFLVLISLTSPVLSSVASLLTIFIVAIADWVITGEALSVSALVGGVLITVAFLVLAWSTWREMTEKTEQKAGYEETPVDWDSEDENSDHGSRSHAFHGGLRRVSVSSNS